MAMVSHKTLSLAAADDITRHAIEAATENGFKPVTITVLDSFGFVLVQKRMDGCPPTAYVKLSLAKAQTCIGVQNSSRGFREKYTGSGEAARFTQAAAMVTVTGGELAPIAGGVLIKDADGAVLGSVGVSGAAADEDEYLAWVGVSKTSGLEDCVTVPETHSCTTLKDDTSA